MYTLQEVADEIRMKWSWVDKKVRTGKIAVVKMGGTRLINEDELERIKTEGVK